MVQGLILRVQRIIKISQTENVTWVGSPGGGQLVRVQPAVQLYLLAVYLPIKQ